MIVVDAWSARLGATVSFTVGAEGRERALAIFTRSVPPRLARLTDRTSDVAVYQLAGPHPLAIARSGGPPAPPAPRPGPPAPNDTTQGAPPPESAPLPLPPTPPGA